jgi:hypothetical protein
MSFLRSIAARLLPPGPNVVRSLASTASPNVPAFQPEYTFVEEPIGLPASTGHGYITLKLGQRIGPSQSFEILRKLGWGSYVSAKLLAEDISLDGSQASVWLAKDHEYLHHDYCFKRHLHVLSSVLGNMWRLKC